MSAIEAYRMWNDDEPEPEIEFEVNFIPRKISISLRIFLGIAVVDIYF